MVLTLFVSNLPHYRIETIYNVAFLCYRMPGPCYDKSNKLNGPELIPWDIFQLMVLVECDALAWPLRASSYTFCVPSSMLVTSESLHSGPTTGVQFLHGLVSSYNKNIGQDALHI